MCAAIRKKIRAGAFLRFHRSIDRFRGCEKKLEEEKNVRLDLDRFRTTLFIGCDVPLGCAIDPSPRVGRERPSLTPEKIASGRSRAPERALARRRRRRASTVTLDDARRLTDRPRNGTMAAFTVSMNGTCRFRPRRAIARGPSDAPPSRRASDSIDGVKTDRPPIRLARYPMMIDPPAPPSRAR